MIWSTLSHPWQVAFEEAWAAYCAGSVPIGAVIAHRETGDILTRARNRRWEREDYPFSGIRNQEVMHAEVQAILALDDEEYGPGEGVLYTTMEPCPMCLGMWFMSNMRELHFASRDPYAGAVNLLETTWYMTYKHMHAHGPVDGLETISLAMLLVHEYNLRGWDTGVYMQRMREQIPEGIALAQTLIDSGALQEMARDRYDVGVVIDALVNLI